MRCGSNLDLKPLEVYYRNLKLYTPVLDLAKRSDWLYTLAADSRGGLI